MNFVSAELRDLADVNGLFDHLASRRGEVFRELESRRTFRFEHRGKGYFAKLHFGVGWPEVFKNLLQLRLPVVSAANELRAIRRLEALDVPTMTAVAFVDHGGLPPTRHSAIVTAELNDTISLEDLVLTSPPAFALKRKLVHRLAAICRTMHAGGLNHRDLYICHFHLARQTVEEAVPTLYVIDLHRAQLRARTPRRWIVKDIGGLFFSAFDAGLSRHDVLTFMRLYAGKPLRETLVRDRVFWRAVVRRARHLYEQEHGEIPAAIDRITA